MKIWPLCEDLLGGGREWASVHASHSQKIPAEQSWNVFVCAHRCVSLVKRKVRLQVDQIIYCSALALMKECVYLTLFAINQQKLTILLCFFKDRIVIAKKLTIPPLRDR